MSQSSKESQERKLKEAKAKVLAVSFFYKKVFGSPEGKEVFRDLCANFEPDLICQVKDNNPTDITVRSAYKDVISHIERNIRIAEAHYDEIEG